MEKTTKSPWGQKSLFERTLNCCPFVEVTSPKRHKRSPLFKDRLYLEHKIASFLKGKFLNDENVEISVMIDQIKGLKAYLFSNCNKFFTIYCWSQTHSPSFHGLTRLALVLTSYSRQTPLFFPGFSQSALLLQTLCKLHPVLQGDKAYLLSEEEQSPCLQMTLTERESCRIK